MEAQMTHKAWWIEVDGPDGREWIHEEDVIGDHARARAIVADSRGKGPWAFA